MSTVKSKNLQIGTDGTASNNFTIYQPGTPDGTLRVGNGNAGSATDVVTVNSSGNVGVGTSSPTGLLEVNGGNLVLNHTTPQTIYKVSGTEKGYARLNSDVYEINSLSGYNFKVNGFNKMSMDSSGRVTMPNQPAFIAYNSAAIACTSLAADAVVVWDSTAFNTGNHYSTSTGAFTAPITGRYLFNIYIRIDQIESTANNYYHPYWSINGGSFYAGGPLMRLIVSSSSSQAFEFVSEAVVLELQANDTIAFKHGDSSISGGSGASASYVAKQCRMSGYLLG